MELSLTVRRFELTLSLGAIFIRVGGWEAYWNALHGLTIG
jgi:hypothetical protein